MPTNLPSELLEYLACKAYPPGTRLPAIQELSSSLGISTGKLREQLEVVRQLGLVEVRPKTGIRTLDFSFSLMIKTGLAFALALDPEYFFQFGVLRNNIEASFWHQAIRLLQPEDKAHLQELSVRAWSKLRGYPIQIPHEEHRELHLTIFSRLENRFVVGLLEAYWEAYEAVGLNMYADYSYLESVWNYHDQMVQAILIGDEESGYQALVEHTGLIHNRPEISRFQPPEAIKAF